MKQQLSVEQHAGVVIFGTKAISLMEVTLDPVGAGRASRVEALLGELAGILNETPARVMTTQFTID